MRSKVRKLERLIRGNSPVLVAYSGGVDSTCLLATARRVLGQPLVLGVIADSPSLPRRALEDALAVAASFDAPVEVLATRELEKPEYFSNPLNRCYFCKVELFARMDLLARERGFSAIAYGENADDPPHLRPGLRAAAEFAVLAPLKEAGLTKEDVRALSRSYGLPNAEAPAQPCLASRVPHGTFVTREVLGLVERGEEMMRALGFCVFRVRYLSGSGARVEVALNEMPLLLEMRDRVSQSLAEAGFLFTEVDPRGYRPPR